MCALGKRVCKQMHATKRLALMIAVALHDAPRDVVRTWLLRCDCDRIT